MSKEQEIGEILLKLVESDVAVVTRKSGFNNNYYRVTVMENIEISVTDNWGDRNFILSGFRSDEQSRWCNPYVHVELNLPKELGKNLRKAFIANYKRSTKKKNEEAARKYSEAQQKLLDKVHEALKTLA